MAKTEPRDPPEPRPRKSVDKVHPVKNRQEYLDWQKRFVVKTHRKVAPAPLPYPMAVQEEDGVIRLKCRCGNWPAVDAGWRLACCASCGLVYDNVEVPT